MSPIIWRSHKYPIRTDGLGVVGKKVWLPIVCTQLVGDRVVTVAPVTGIIEFSIHTNSDTSRLHLPAYVPWLAVSRAHGTGWLHSKHFSQRMKFSLVGKELTVLLSAKILFGVNLLEVVKTKHLQRSPVHSCISYDYRDFTVGIPK